jgi:hypothetical protein
VAPPDDPAPTDSIRDNRAFSEFQQRNPFKVSTNTASYRLRTNRPQTAKPNQVNRVTKKVEVLYNDQEEELKDEIKEEED